MKTPKLLVILAGLAIAVAGCGTATDSTTTSNAAPQDEPERLQGKTFLSTKVTENGQPRDLVADSRVSLEFTEDGRLSASAGCNNLRGEVDLGDGRISVPDIPRTEMGCMPAELMEQDEWLAKILLSDPSWRFEQEDLVVKSGTTELVLADREEVEPDLPLEGTKWRVDAVNESTKAGGDGDHAVTSSGLGTDKAWLKVAKGKVEGFGGCNSFGGSVEVSGDSIEFQPVVATRRACADQAINETETKLLSILDGKVDFEIEATRLTLTNSGGDGLTLSGKR